MILSTQDICFELLHIFSKLRPIDGGHLSRQQLTQSWAGTRLRKNDLETASNYLVADGLLVSYTQDAERGLRLTERGVAHATELSHHPLRNQLRRWRIRWMVKLMRSRSILGVQRRHNDQRA